MSRSNKCPAAGRWLRFQFSRPRPAHQSSPLTPCFAPFQFGVAVGGGHLGPASGPHGGPFSTRLVNPVPHLQQQQGPPRLALSGPQPSAFASVPSQIAGGGPLRAGGTSPRPILAAGHNGPVGPLAGLRGLPTDPQRHPGVRPAPPGIGYPSSQGYPVGNNQISDPVKFSAATQNYHQSQPAYPATSGTYSTTNHQSGPATSDGFSATNHQVFPATSEGYPATNQQSYPATSVSYPANNHHGYSADGQPTTNQQSYPANSQQGYRAASEGHVACPQPLGSGGTTGGYRQTAGVQGCGALPPSGPTVNGPIPPPTANDQMLPTAAPAEAPMNRSGEVRFYTTGLGLGSYMGWVRVLPYLTVRWKGSEVSKQVKHATRKLTYR